MLIGSPGSERARSAPKCAGSVLKPFTGSYVRVQQAGLLMEGPHPPRRRLELAADPISAMESKGATRRGLIASWMFRHVFAAVIRRSG